MTSPEDLDRLAQAIRTAAPGPVLTPDQYADRLADRRSFTRQQAYLDRLNNRRSNRSTTDPKDRP